MRKYRIDKWVELPTVATVTELRRRWVLGGGWYQHKTFKVLTRNGVIWYHESGRQVWRGQLYHVLEREWYRRENVHDFQVNT